MEVYKELHSKILETKVSISVIIESELWYASMMIVKCALDQKVEDLSKEKRRLRRREEVKKWLTIPGISLNRSDRYTLIKNATKS